MANRYRNPTQRTPKGARRNRWRPSIPLWAIAVGCAKVKNGPRSFLLGQTGSKLGTCIQLVAGWHLVPVRARGVCENQEKHLTHRGSRERGGLGWARRWWGGVRKDGEKKRRA